MRLTYFGIFIFAAKFQSDKQPECFDQGLLHVMTIHFTFDSYFKFSDYLTWHFFVYLSSY